MIIELTTSSEIKKIKVLPSVMYQTYCESLEFPDIEYNSDMQPIIHEVELVVSLEVANDEYEISEEIEENLKKKYWIDKEKNHIIIGKMTMTEFLDSWRENMGASWSYWLDALDGDHLVVGSRADEIIKRDLYDDPFDFGSLFYIQDH